MAEDVLGLFPLSEKSRQYLSEAGFSVSFALDGKISHDVYYIIDTQRKAIKIMNLPNSRDSELVDALLYEATKHISRSSELPSEYYY